jgi:hypothetical protein
MVTTGPAEVAEFPDIKVSAFSISVAVARLREALWQRMRWTKVATSCAGEAISPVPRQPTSTDLAATIEVEVETATGRDLSAA